MHPDSMRRGYRSSALPTRSQLCVPFRIKLIVSIALSVCSVSPSKGITESECVLGIPVFVASQAEVWWPGDSGEHPQN